MLHCKLNAILDGTFAYGHAMDNIERSLKHNHRVIIYYLFQDPVVAWTFTQIREQREGRRVSKEVFIHAFIHSRENVAAAKAHYGAKIELNLIIKDFTKNFEQLFDGIDSIDTYLPRVYTEEKLKTILQ